MHSQLFVVEKQLCCPVVSHGSAERFVFVNPSLLRVFHTQGPQSAQLAKEMHSLKQQLKLKEALESVMEGKHSKLAEVYKALDAECQAELAGCRGGQVAALRCFGRNKY